MRATLRELSRLVAVPRARLALAAALGALTVLCGVGLMATAGYLITRAAERPAILALGVAIVGVRFFGLTRPIARYAERLASHDLALGALGRARSKVFERVEPLAPAELEAYRDGDLLERMVGDVDALQDLHLRGILPSLVAASAGAISVGAVAAFLPAAGLVLAAGLVAGGLLVPPLSAALARRSAQRQAGARGELSAELVQLERSAAEVVAFGAEEERLERVAELDAELVRAGRRGALAAGLGEGLGMAVMGMTVAGVLAVAISAQAGDGLDRVLVAMLALLAMAAFESVQPLPAALTQLREATARGARVLELMGRSPRVTDPDPAAEPPRGPFELVVDDVRARYQGQPTPAVDGVSLRLKPGGRIALLGPSGSGKTTVANLLLRFLDPERGRVVLAGRDLRDYRQEDVRELIAVAGQDSHLFSASIRENVRIGRPEAGDEEIERALARAQILDWVRTLPDELDTLVGFAGAQLSGGQRQRLSLARALLADAPVLVLDEPVAHLDHAAADALVRDALAAAADRSVLLITHRDEGLDLVEEIVTI